MYLSDTSVARLASQVWRVYGLMSLDRRDGMPFIQAGSYAVASRRGLDATNVLNSIRVVPTPFVGAGNGIDFVDLTFDATSAIPVGSIIPRRVFASFPREDFESHRLVFQTEAPIEIEWVANPANPAILVSIQVRTQQEPLGEGPTDTS